MAASSFEETRRLRGHRGAILCVRYTSDGSYCMSAGSDRSVKLWNPERDAEKTGGLLIQTYDGHAQEATGVAIAKDSATFVSCGADKLAILWDVATGQKLRKFLGHNARVNSVALEQSILATAGYDNVVKLWDLRGGYKPLQNLTDFTDSVTSVTFRSPQIISSSVDGCLRYFDVRRGLLQCDSFGLPLTHVAVKDTLALVSCLDSSLRLLELSSGRQLQIYTGHTHTTYGIEATFSHDDAWFVSGSEDGDVVLWESSASSPIKLRHHRGTTGIDYDHQPVPTVAWHPKEPKLLAGGFDGAISAWRRR